MDKLVGCALAFEKLLDVQYRMIVGRKGKAVELLVGFSMLDFHHLMGLGKLKDLRLATMNREMVFKEILNGKISYEVITKSRYIHLIENRFQPLLHIEQLFDDNCLVFRYNPKLNQFSLIEADYLLTRLYEKNNKKPPAADSKPPNGILFVYIVYLCTPTGIVINQATQFRFIFSVTTHTLAFAAMQSIFSFSDVSTARQKARKH